MDKVKELLMKKECHVLSVEEQKELKGGLIMCDCGTGTIYFVETVAECEKWCKMIKTL